MLLPAGCVAGAEAELEEAAGALELLADVDVENADRDEDDSSERLLLFSLLFRSLLDDSLRFELAEDDELLVLS